MKIHTLDANLHCQSFNFLFIALYLCINFSYIRCISLLRTYP